MRAIESSVFFWVDQTKRESAATSIRAGTKVSPPLGVGEVG